MAFQQTSRLQRLIEATELKEIALKRLAQMPEAARLQPPSDGRWSAAGVVEHLIIVEESLAGSWRERLAQGQPVKLGVRATLLACMVSAVMGQTSIMVPTVPELVPKRDVPLSELGPRWEKARKALIDALPDDPDAAWILHPALGPLSSSQMGVILAAHLKYHLRHWPAPVA